MTYREYISAVVAKFGASQSDINLILANQVNAIPDADADVDARIAKSALVQEFATLIPLQNVSEGGYSVSWNMDAVKMWYNLTCGELGIVPKATQPTIRNKSNMW